MTQQGQPTKKLGADERSSRKATPGPKTVPGVCFSTIYFGYVIAMLPIKMSSVFKSRWMALIWSAGIIWTAVDFAGGSDSGNSSDNNTDQAAQSVESAWGQQASQ